MKITKNDLRKLIRETLQQEVSTQTQQAPTDFDWTVIINGKKVDEVFSDLGKCLQYIQNEYEWRADHDADPIEEIHLEQHNSMGKQYKR